MGSAALEGVLGVGGVAMQLFQCLTIREIGAARVVSRMTIVASRCAAAATSVQWISGCGRPANALMGLAAFAGRGDAAAVSLLTVCLEDRDWSIRAIAANGIGKVAERGDTLAITALLSRLGDETAAVQREAVRALPKIATKGDGRIVTGLVGRLKDGDPGNRIAVANALASIAEKDDGAAVSALTLRASFDDDRGTPEAACHALAKLRT
eukprot:NODE_17433_length_943_cov_1.837010.p2 GENE.NODE_17433_length_943_cov_1.837010~~NODE_17433_length_943_cov_1.837010.p2  ORF type:complete len:210 (+),score=48.42 NODE_17433_length_943_cov_1.837010:111-740(+)